MNNKDKGRLWPAAYVLLFFLTAGVILRQSLMIPSCLFLMVIIGALIITRADGLWNLHRLEKQVL